MSDVPDGGPDADGDPADDADDNEETPVGDGRQKHVTLVRASGERIEHGDVFLKHSSTGFLVSPDPEFPDEETTRYAKAEFVRAEISQHHSACFITTATAGGAELDALRDFRDDVLARSLPGRALVRVYDAVSPPVARTLSRRPGAATTRGVRWLVERCAGLARRQAETDASVRSAALSAVLVVLYVVGVWWAVLGHLAIRGREVLEISE